MEDSETQQQHLETQQQQVTSKTPATKQKNPKRVAAGKAIAQKTKLAREAQKKVLIEAQSIIPSKQSDPPPVSDPPAETSMPWTCFCLRANGQLSG